MRTPAIPGRALVRAVLLACLGTVVVSAAPARFPGADAKWRHYQSPHFELFSRVDDPNSRALLHELEVLRAMFVGTLRIEARAPVPVTIVHFGGVRDFRAYLSPEFAKIDSYRGYYLHHADRGVMLLAPLDSERTGNHVALGSYVGHLFRMAGERPPPWFQHGFGDLFETLEVGGDRVFFGRPSPGNVHFLQMRSFMPLESLLGVDWDDPLFKDERRSRLFFAQSWATVHFWLLGKHEIPRERIDAFLRHARTHPRLDAETRRRVFEQAFGMSFEAMNRLIEDYVTDGRYTAARVPLPPVAALKTYVRRDVPLEEITVRLAEVAYRMNRDPAGKFVLLDQVGRDRADCRSLEVLGAVALNAGDADEGRSRWNEAFDRGSTNPAVLRQLAENETKTWFRQIDPYFRLSAETEERLRLMLRRSIECAPGQSAAYEQLAWVESAAQAPNLANVNRVQEKFDSLDDRPRTLLALAMVRVRLEDRATALRLLDSLDAMEPNLSVRQGAERLRAMLEGRPPRRLEGPAEARPRGMRIAPGLRKPE